jgi:hypothetical protein
VTDNMTELSRTPTVLPDGLAPAHPRSSDGFADEKHGAVVSGGAPGEGKIDSSADGAAADPEGRYVTGRKLAIIFTYAVSGVLRGRVC